MCGGRAGWLRIQLGGDTSQLERFPLALNHSVMAGLVRLVPAIHVSLRCGTDVDARHGPAAGPAKQAGPGWPGMTEHMGEVEREPL